ncbi:hypothetical protein DFH08DRAFT_709957, partial [Mycena albidolilacea]
ENRINKIIGGPKKSFLQLFDGLNERSEDQTTKEFIQVRQAGCFIFRLICLIHSTLSPRRQHESNLESLFAAPLKLIRQYAGGFALQTCCGRVPDGLFCATEVIQRPNEPQLG